MPETRVTDSASTLRAAGLKVTAPRTAVLHVLESMAHVTADQVFTAVRPTLPGTSLQAVYGVLAALTDAAIIRRIEPAGSPARYERRVGDNHHHLVCTGCGAVADVDCAVGHAPCLTPSNTEGFVATSAEITFWGLCTNCAASNTDQLEENRV